MKFSTVFAITLTSTAQAASNPDQVKREAAAITQAPVVKARDDPFSALGSGVQSLVNELTDDGGDFGSVVNSIISEELSIGGPAASSLYKSLTAEASGYLQSLSDFINTETFDSAAVASASAALSSATQNLGSAESSASKAIASAASTTSTAGVPRQTAAIAAAALLGGAAAVVNNF